MSNNRRSDLRNELSDEVWEELTSLEGNELDEYLASLALDSDALLKSYSNALASARAAPKRAQFEEARRIVRQNRSTEPNNIFSFDLPTKKKIMNSIREHADRTQQMTVAARNRKVENENDIDVFLEACLRLGIIDGDGHLKE
jgi:hypothetical protein